jgi:hypothetical protein
MVKNPSPLFKKGVLYPNQGHILRNILWEDLSQLKNLIHPFGHILRIVTHINQGNRT